jgi:diaminopimelate decarboxylase
MVSMEDYNEIKQLEEKFDTPFYIFEPKNLIKNYQDIDTAFKSRYDNFIIGYSYKTNYLPYLCKMIKDLGGYAEVVSRLEYELALKLGYDTSRIIFNGPLKTYSDLKLAIANNSIINLDSFYEIEHIKKISQEFPDKEIKLGLRVNLQFLRDGVSNIQEGLEISRFGFGLDDSGIGSAIEKLNDLENVKVTGLHGHTSTTSRALWIYEKITKTLCELANKYLANRVEYIDVGGGIYGKVPREMIAQQIPTFDDYADAICGIMNETDWAVEPPSLILEPGTAMVANSLDFVVKVIEIKKINGNNIVLVNGSAINSKPTFHKLNNPVEVIPEREEVDSDIYDLVGYTCMEKDYLINKLKMKKLEIGDYIKIKNVGAYTIVLTPPFIKEEPPILVSENGTYREIRKRQTVDNFFLDYEI